MVKRKINKQSNEKNRAKCRTIQNYYYLCIAIERKTIAKHTGEMAEWSIAAVLKTVELRGSGGSNPSLSAER